MGIYLPFVAPWLSAIGIRGAALGWIAATRPLAGIIAPVLFGWFADSLGLRGRILRLAAIGAFLPFAWLGLSAILGHLPSPLELWFAIAISSFFRVPMSTMADVTALEKSSGYGTSRAFGSIGFMVAALSAGLLLNSTSHWRFPLGVAATLLLAYALSLGFPSRVAVERSISRREVMGLLGNTRFASLLAVSALWQVSHVGYDLLISLHLRDLGASHWVTSVAWTIAVIAEIALMLFWDRLRSFARSERWLLVGLMLTTLRWCVLAFVDSLALALWLQPLHAFSFALVWLALMDLIRAHSPSVLLASAQGMFSASCAVGGTIGMVLFGWVYAGWFGRGSFALAAVIAASACVAYMAGPVWGRLRWLRPATAELVP
jgi:MFS transporter, PPP family, 3-phenylpropionic acid transporter